MIVLRQKLLRIEYKTQICLRKHEHQTVK